MKKGSTMSFNSSKEVAKIRLARLRRDKRSGTSCFGLRRSTGDRSTGDRSPACERSTYAECARVAAEAEFDAGRVRGSVPPPASHGSRLGAGRASPRQGRASAPDGDCKEPRRDGPRARKLADPHRRSSLGLRFQRDESEANSQSPYSPMF